MSRLISMYEREDHSEPAYPGGPERTLDCDIAVVGGGGSGLSAAARAAELGARVLVVEKMEAVGGNSRLAGGLLSTDSQYQKSLGFRDRTEDYIKTAFSHNKYLLDPHIIRRYLNNSGVYLDWLIANGMDMSNTRWIFDGAVCLVREPEEYSSLQNPSYGPGLMGSKVMHVLEDLAEKHSIPILLNTKAQSITLSEDGSVSGLTAVGQDCTYRISAPAVILSSGGFAGNPSMLRRFLPAYFTSDNCISHYSMSWMTGDGIEMAEAAGARVGENISAGISGLCHIPGAYPIQKIVNEPVGIIVNAKGRRFIDENDTDNSEFVVDRQPDGLAYYLIDSAGLDLAFSEALKHIPNGDRPPAGKELDEALVREKREGRLAEAVTVSDLSSFIGCSPDALVQTVDRYNEFCRAGKDEDFYKAPELLHPVASGPFYAIRLQRNFDVTMGGISIDSGLRALRPDGSAIPGLYASGDTASNWMGPEYGPIFSSFCWALNSGYLAGEDAAHYLK